MIYILMFIVLLKLDAPAFMWILFSACAAGDFAMFIHNGDWPCLI